MEEKLSLDPRSNEKKALSAATLAALVPPLRPLRPPVFNPRPAEVPSDLQEQAKRLRGLTSLLQKEAWKTLQAFNAKGFTFPHELDVILTDLEHKADQLFTYLNAENYTRRIYREADSAETDSQDRRETAG